jgi:hypothetical protein
MNASNGGIIRPGGQMKGKETRDYLKAVEADLNKQARELKSQSKANTGSINRQKNS